MYGDYNQGWVEVIESVVYDLTKLSEDLEKVLKCKYAYSYTFYLQQVNILSLNVFQEQISLFTQR